MPCSKVKVLRESICLNIKFFSIYPHYTRFSVVGLFNKTFSLTFLWKKNVFFLYLLFIFLRNFLYFVYPLLSSPNLSSIGLLPCNVLGTLTLNHFKKIFAVGKNFFAESKNSFQIFSKTLSRIFTVGKYQLLTKQMLIGSA